MEYNVDLISTQRGELILTSDEAEKLNELIIKSNFRLDPCISLDTQKVKKAKSTESRRTSKSQSFADDYTPYRSKKHTSTSFDGRYLDSFDRNSSFDERRSSRVRKQPITFLEEFYDDHVDESYNPHSERHTQKSTKSAPKKEKAPPVPLYKTVPASIKHLPKLPKNTWEYACYRMLQMIKYMDTDKWFWYPVDPVIDGVPNYLNVIKRPMDFHTIIERLHNKHYSSPFGWQIDMRQIFYNAFLFYPPDNIIWQTANTLAVSLENKLKGTKYLNPDEFLQSLMMDPAIVREDIEAMFVPRHAKKSYSKEDYKEETKPLGPRKASKKRNLIIDMIDVEDLSDDDYESYASSVYSDDGFSFKSGKSKGKKEVRRGRKPTGKFVPGSYPKALKYANGSDVSKIPEYGHVPPPPPLQTFSVSERSLTVAQQKTLEFNLSRLAPNQRKAALELVQDDLGILAEAYKNDKDFKFDTDLLSIEKQRQFFVYVNQMAKRNYDIMLKNSEKAMPVDVHSLTKTEGTKAKAPSVVFDASSSSSSLSDVASNFLSSDEFFSSSDSDVDLVPEKSANATREESIPEYKPVDEFESDKPHLSEVIMGDHADFLGKMDTPHEESATTQGKKSAWMEWKGQAIHHGMVAQQSAVPPRSVDEQIAESFDARI